MSVRATKRVQVQLRRASVVAGAHAADVVAMGVELANPVATAITTIMISVAGRDRAADQGCADEAGADAPAKDPRLARMVWWTR